MAREQWKEEFSQQYEEFYEKLKEEKEKMDEILKKRAERQARKKEKEEMIAQSLADQVNGPQSIQLSARSLTSQKSASGSKFSQRKSQLHQGGYGEDDDNSEEEEEEQFVHFMDIPEPDPNLPPIEPPENNNNNKNNKNNTKKNNSSSSSNSATDLQPTSEYAKKVQFNITQLFTLLGLTITPEVKVLVGRKDVTEFQRSLFDGLYVDITRRIPIMSAIIAQAQHNDNREAERAQQNKELEEKGREEFRKAAKWKAGGNRSFASSPTGSKFPYGRLTRTATQASLNRSPSTFSISRTQSQLNLMTTPTSFSATSPVPNSASGSRPRGRLIRSTTSAALVPYSSNTNNSFQQFPPRVQSSQSSARLMTPVQSSARTSNGSTSSRRLLSSSQSTYRLRTSASTARIPRAVSASPDQVTGGYGPASASGSRSISNPRGSGRRGGF